MSNNNCQQLLRAQSSSIKKTFIAKCDEKQYIAYQKIQHKLEESVCVFQALWIRWYLQPSSLTSRTIRTVDSSDLMRKQYHWARRSSYLPIWSRASCDSLKPPFWNNPSWVRTIHPSSNSVNPCHPSQNTTLTRRILTISNGSTTKITKTISKYECTNCVH